MNRDSQEVRVQLTLTQEVQAFIDEEVRSGRFPTAQDVVLSALERLRHDMRDGFAEGELDALIEEGEADIAAGKLLDEEEVFQRIRAKSDAYRSKNNAS